MTKLNVNSITLLEQRLWKLRHEAFRLYPTEILTPEPIPQNFVYPTYEAMFNMLYAPNFRNYKMSLARKFKDAPFLPYVIRKESKLVRRRELVQANEVARVMATYIFTTYFFDKLNEQFQLNMRVERFITNRRIGVIAMAIMMLHLEERFYY